jgi:hypothetical protein
VEENKNTTHATTTKRTLNGSQQRDKGHTPRREKAPREREEREINVESGR